MAENGSEWKRAIGQLLNAQVSVGRVGVLVVIVQFVPLSPRSGSARGNTMKHDPLIRFKEKDDGRLVNLWGSGRQVWKIKVIITNNRPSH